MPRRKNEYDHVKVYRPNGSRYSEGRGVRAEECLVDCERNFIIEFGDLPRLEHRVYEILGVTGGYAGNLFEVKE